MPVTITATGYIELLKDGALVSRHTQVEDAIESAIARGEGSYRIRYPERRVEVALPVITATRPTSRTPFAPPTGGGSNNPDGWATATTTYVSKDYSTEVGSDVLSATNIATGTWGSGYGYGGGGAWRFSPQPIDGATSNEDSAGWNTGMGSLTVDTCNTLVYSFMFYISQPLVDAILDPVSQGGGSSFWSSNNKVVDIFMWNSGGTSHDTTTRQVVMFGKSNGDNSGLLFTPVAGGAGGVTGIAPIATLDFTNLADQWIWLAFVFDASTGSDATNSTRLYYKKSGDSGVTKFYHRTGSQDGGGGADDSYKYTTRGWIGDIGRTLFGYWDDMNGGTVLRNSTRYVTIDRLRIGNGWFDPPF